MTLLQDIQYLADTKKDSKKDIADFILSHKTELAHLTLDDIQEQAYISKSSLVRFAKALGFSGWKAFLVPLVEEIHKESQTFSYIDPDIPFTPLDSNLTIAAKIAQVQTASIEDSLALLDEDILTRAAYSLKKANRIVVFGISPNNLLATIFRRRLSAIGKTVEVPQQDEMGLTALSLKDSDLAVFISYSGHLTQFPAQLMTYLSENQVTRLAITSQKHSPLAEACDLLLTLSAREQVVGKISSFASEESILFILNVLYAVYFSLDYKTNMDYKQRMAELLEKGRL
ncbi:MurR/RpiR family transcriptional regulator [Streptococcus chenjunshii]|uniref:MurR/RpiR family transcriptional regulator n=1 Tax=Streptococcus chenjunshii TaxID=2173853 RepID=A0A372KPK2_9STRE|nr:MurR/RpiR family transcriptional regulator [Streptococcus chenjunshii]AXQ78501.1 MurR/RpiR family transcriptional regulator [Streptococcus chenjunshii]RFU52038.1 MurR/RpiR family transcriptional regulator [Streptococcus chenjunshii]RFU54230.1 MurR/RpiR family transcriptional regulator [Streptococcus chenjunshii]